jgi:hypothetical protein
MLTGPHRFNGQNAYRTVTETNQKLRGDLLAKLTIVGLPGSSKENFVLDPS